MKTLYTIKPLRIFRKQFPFSLLLVLCAPAMVQAEISIRDNWARGGEVFLGGVGWDAEFRKEQGALIITSNKKVLRILPFDSNGKKSESTASCKVIEDNKKKEEVEIRAIFSAGQKQIEGSFFFKLDGTIEIKPSQNMEGICIFSKIAYGVLPGVILDDIIYDPKKYRSATKLHIPSENLFVGLLEGRDTVLVCGWPPGDQKVNLIFGNGGKRERLIEAVRIQLDGKSAYIRSISAPVIWHKEQLLPSYLEKDREIGWKRPFAAKWKTHLNEINNIKTAFPFRSKRSRPWRPRIGWYIYPVWFDGDKSMFHLSKKVPPSGEVLVYALEGHKDTPVEFARKCLGRISPFRPKERLRRYPQNNAGFKNCDGRDRVKKIFKAGLQRSKQELLQKVMSDFLYSINTDKRRLEEYANFISRMDARIDSWNQREKENPELQSFFRQMKNHIRKLEEEYHRRMRAKTASEHLRQETEAINKVKVLITQEGPEVYSEASRLLGEIKLWSLMEEVPASVGALGREWARQAAYACAQNIAAVEFAEQIRREVREFIGTGATYETVY